MNISILVIGNQPLSNEELDLWNQTHKGAWERFCDLFIVEVIRFSNGARIVRDVIPNDEARALLIGLRLPSSVEGGL